MAKRRSWARFSLRTLIVMTLVASFAFGWLGMLKERGKKRAEAIAAIRAKGGTVHYKIERPVVKNSTPTWYQSIDKFVRKQLGNDAIDEVKAINLFAKQIDVFDLRYLEPFPELEILHLGMNRIDDEDLTHLPSFRKLRVLTLQVTRVTDEGLPELHRFRTLERLILPSDGEQVSEAAIVRLRKALPNCDIEQ